ncbi:AHNAK nucleoprotein 2 [Apodemus speciosus]|uniref:AHNAK nucleoprotein 2 n=1 Tax=Apodemus speciosus TaxID=105296 RepID=A0ABQ0FF17_APOSI
MWNPLWRGAPKVEADVALPSAQGDLKTPDLSIQLPSAQLELQASQVSVKLPEGQMPEGEMPAQAAAGADLKGHLPKVQMPSLKMPKVDLKGPHVDLKGPKVDSKGTKGEVSAPDLDVPVPAVDVDIQLAGPKLEGDLALGDKEVAAKDSKFKMPKFKMPSFGTSAPGKPSVEASLEVVGPKVHSDVALPSVQGDLKTPDVTIQLPSAELELQASQVGVKMPEGQMPEGEMPAQAAAGAGVKGHLPKVQMPSLKMPKVDLKGPHVDLTGPKVDVKGVKDEVSAPDLEVSVPAVEVDIQALGANLEGDLALGDKDVATKDSKFKMPKFKMPFFGVSVPGKSSVEASLEGGAPKVEADVALPSVQGDLKTPDLSIQLPSAELELQTGQVGVKLPEGQMPEGEMPVQAAAGAGLKGHLPKVQMSSLKTPNVDLQGPHVDLKGPKVDLKGTKGDVSASNQEGLFQSHDGSFNSVRVSTRSCHGYSSSSEASQVFFSYGRPTLNIDDPSHGYLDPSVPPFTARIMFPKFHKPKFSLSVPPSESECTLPDSVPVVQPRVTSPTLPGSAGPQVLSSDASVCSILDPPSSQPLISQSLETSSQEAKDSSFKLPSIKLPSFNWSPKKAAAPTGDSQAREASLALSSLEMDSENQSSVSEVESPQHAPLDRDVEKGRSRKLSFSMPRLALPKRKVSKGSAAVPPGDSRPSLTGTTCGGDSEVLETAASDALVGDTHSKDVTTELHVRYSSTTAELARSRTELPPPKDDLNVRGDSKCLMIVSASQPFGELITPRAEGPQQPSGGQTDNAPTMEAPEMDPTAEETSRDSNERWFKLPKFRAPGFRRSSSKERDRAGEQEAPQKSQPEVIGTTLGTEAKAAACVQLSHVPESRLETHISLVSPEEGTSVRPLESPTYADVVKRDPHGTGSTMHSPTAERPHTHLSTPEFGTHPSKGFVSLEVPGVRVSELQLPPEGTDKQHHLGPGGDILAEMEARTGSLPSQPQGPLRLKASITDVPSQVSVVSTSQLWEDSVLTVTFPKLKVPRFSFPAPSSETDVFFPVVREIEASTGSPMQKVSTRLWEASILKTGAEDTRTPPASLEQSLEANPVSKVRVHIQGSRGESQEVAISGRVERAHADPLAPGAFCTQIVRESEIPASTIQTPSYGFSLLKAKIPEPPVQACVYTVALDSQTQEGVAGAPTPAASGRHSTPAEVPPDTGEPFEIISSSAGVPPGPQLADSTSDEEPAEILEFPEDSQEVKAPDMDTKQKPEGKKASLLWSWLPSIGFSSVEEAAADSRDATQRSPVHVQPTARLDPELPRKQEKAGWFRFPKLGFSSSPTKKPRSTEDGEGQAEPKLQEETVTFFDARESFSPEEEEEAKSDATSARPGSEGMVASSARTELALLEQARDTGDKSIPRPVAK